MTEIWQQRVCGQGAVVYGGATLFIAWRQDETGQWHMLGSRWSRDEAETLFN